MPVSINNPANVIINNGARVIAANPIPPIVQDGLVLNLDAQNIFSYPRVGNTWYDLGIELTHTSLISGSSFNSSNGGYISFDGTNDYATATTLSNSLLNVGSGGIVTIEFFIRVNSFPTGDGTIFKYGTSSMFTAAYRVGLTNLGRIIAHTGTTTMSSTGISITIGTWNHIVMIFKSGGRTYINGINEGTSIGLDPTGKTHDLFWIAANTASETVFFPFDLGLIRIYNRELLEDEVSQNFNASRSRFGI